MIGAFWVYDGIDNCMVGLLPPAYLQHRMTLEGRIAQVVEFLDNSNDPDKKAFSADKEGVARLVLIDKPQLEDLLIKSMLYGDDSE